MRQGHISNHDSQKYILRRNTSQRRTKKFIHFIYEQRRMKKFRHVICYMLSSISLHLACLMSYTYEFSKIYRYLKNEKMKKIHFSHIVKISFASSLIVQNKKSYPFITQQVIVIKFLYKYHFKCQKYSYNRFGTQTLLLIYQLRYLLTRLTCSK